MKKLYFLLLELLYPRKCVLCQKLLEPQETDLCGACRICAPESPPGEKSVRFCGRTVGLWRYQGQVRESLLRFKFSGRRCYAQAYGRLLAMRLDPTEFDVITWAPISPRRRRQRGYDQVELLAQAVSRELELPCLRLLEKIRDNPPQSSIREPAQRRANVLGVYRAVSAAPIQGRRICLLDDVCTTGATLSECARVLAVAGAAEITAAAVAVAQAEPVKKNTGPGSLEEAP